MKRPLLFLIYSICFSVSGQFKPVFMVDSKFCISCQSIINSIPKEVLLGVDIDKENTVIFKINSVVWFNKIFQNPKYGLAIQLVPATNFDCKNPNQDTSFWFDALPSFELKRKAKIEGNTVTFKIGQLPTRLIGQTLEANLAILNSEKICFFTSFVNLDDTEFDLLPMGLFANKLIFENEKIGENLITKKAQFSLFFSKNSAVLNQIQFKKIKDSLRDNEFKIQQIHIEAFTSLEGSFEANKLLQQQRADAVKAELSLYLTDNVQFNTNTSENFDDFRKDIIGTKFQYLQKLSDEELSKKLKNKELLNALELIFAKHRKSILNLELVEEVKNLEIQQKNWASAIQTQNIEKARTILEKIFKNSIQKPEKYLDKLEIPNQKNYADLLNNDLVYNHLLKLKSLEETIEKFEELLKKDPQNKQFQYNAITLKLTQWFDSKAEIRNDDLYSQILNLRKIGIDQRLVRRMILNFQIIQAAKMLKLQRFEEKDKAVIFILSKYADLDLSANESLQLAKFLVFHSRIKEAKAFLASKLEKEGSSEDLIFYFININLLDSKNTDQAVLETAIESAKKMNPKRFCKLFSANTNGGASFQLLENPFFKKNYCGFCP